ncbi:MAG: hypothetical protein R6W82_06815 [bacterium]
MSPITVGVVARRGPQALQRTLDALSPQVGPDDDVLVVPGPSRAAVRNRLLEDASAPVVAFLEDGLRPAPRWMDAWRGTFRDEKIEAAAGSFQPRPGRKGEGGGGGRIRWTGRLESDFTGTRTAVTTLGRGTNFAVRRGPAVEQGGFDEDFGPADPYGDAEFFLRLAKGGARTWFVPGARILDPDPAWRPPGDLPPELRLREEALRARWMAALFARHEVWALPVMVSSHLLQSVLAVAAGDLPASAPARIFRELAAGIRAGVVPPASRLTDRKNVKD